MNSFSTQLQTNVSGSLFTKSRRCTGFHYWKRKLRGWRVRKVEVVVERPTSSDSTEKKEEEGITKIRAISLNCSKVCLSFSKLNFAPLNQNLLFLLHKHKTYFQGKFSIVVGVVAFAFVPRNSNFLRWGGRQYSFRLYFRSLGKPFGSDTR